MSSTPLRPVAARPKTAPIVAPRSAAAPAREVGLLERLNALYKHRYLILSVFLLVVLAAGIRTFSTVPMYSATAQLLIEDERAANMALSDGPPFEYAQDPEPYYQTQYRILIGHELSRRAIGTLHMEQVREFNGVGPEPTRVGQLLNDLERLVKAPLRGWSGADAAGEAADGNAGVDLEDLADTFAGRVSVSPIPESQLVNVSFVAADPTFAAQAANAVVTAYVAQNMELRLRTAENSLGWLAEELERQQQKLEDGEGALASYREVHNALSLEDRQNIVVARLNQLNDAVTRAKTNRVQKEALYEQVEAVGSATSPDSMPAILQNQYLQAIKTRLAELQREKATLSQRYGEKYPEVIKVSASLDDVSRQLADEVARNVEAIRNDYRSAVAEERTLTQALEDQKRVAMDLNRKSAGYSVIERDAESNRQIYETLLQRQKELQVASSSRGNNVRLIEAARVPGAPFSPNHRRTLTLAALVGLALALGLIVAIEQLDHTVKTPEDVRAMKLPLLGLIPAAPRGTIPTVSRTTVDPFGEAFRALRTSVALTAGADGTRIVMITSAQPLEGKTTTACNLARALAHGGSRVLLIDADMRRPGVHLNFGLDNKCGLSDVLGGRAPAHHAVHRLVDPDLWVMPAGPTPDNPSELLGSLRMSALMSNARSGPFDWVIVDTPPVLAVTDALILTPWVSGVALVLGSERTTRPHVERVLETLQPSRAPILGVILNQVDFVRNKYYYSRYYGSSYTKYVRPAA